MALTAPAVMAAAKVAAPVAAGVKKLIPTIGDLLGGLFGSKKTATPDYTHLKQGIQWKVADAKAAGIHPLYALGAQVGSPTISSETGSNVGNAIQAAAQSFPQNAPGFKSNPLIAAQINAQNASAARDFALAARTMSDVKRAQQASNAQPTLQNIAGDTTMAIDPGAITAEKAEERYGEIGEFIGGAVTGGADTVANIPQSFWDYLVDRGISVVDARRRLAGYSKRKYQKGWPSSRRPYQSLFSRSKP